MMHEFHYAIKKYPRKIYLATLMSVMNHIHHMLHHIHHTLQHMLDLAISATHAHARTHTDTHNSCLTITLKSRLDMSSRIFETNIFLFLAGN